MVLLTNAVIARCRIAAPSGNVRGRRSSGCIEFLRLTRSKYPKAKPLVLVSVGIRCRFAISLLPNVISRILNEPYAHCLDLYCQQYHAFGAIRLCYPKDFFHDSLQALRIQENTETPTSSLTKLSKTSENAEKDHPGAVMADAVASASAASSAAAAAAAANEVLGAIGIHQPKESGGAVAGGAARFEVEKERWMLSSMPWADLGSHASSKRQAAEDALAHARLRPLPTVRDPRLEGPARRGSRKSSLRRPGPTTHHAVGAREKDTNVGNGYWDLVGSKTGLRGQAVEQREEVATATASVVLLRWAMEDKGGNEDVDMSEDGVESAGESEWEPFAGDKVLKEASNTSICVTEIRPIARPF